MRWIIAIEPEVPLPRGRGRGRADGVRRAASSATPARTPSPSSRRRAWRSRPSASACPPRRRRSSSRCRSSRRSTACAGLRRRSARPRCRSCRRSSWSSSRGTDLIQARQLVQERLSHGRADAADVGRAAGDAPAASRRPAAVMQIGVSSKTDVADGSCRRSPTGRSGRGCCACPASSTSRSGASASSRSTSTSIPRGCRRSDVSLDDVMNTTADVARRRAAAATPTSGT